MSQKARHTLAVLIGQIHTDRSQRIMEGIRDAAQELDLNIYFFLDTAPSRQELPGYIADRPVRFIYEYRAFCGMDGMIIAWDTLTPELMNSTPSEFLSRMQNVPVVLLSEDAKLPNCRPLLSDNEQGIQTLMEHLIQDHDYRKILYLSGPERNADAIQRRSAYLKAMWGQNWDKTMMAVVQRYEDAEQQVESLLDAHPDAEAIVFANDQLALAGYRVCDRRGLNVGKDIAIAAYGDGTPAAEPSLTTVSQNSYLSGRRAVLELACRLTGQSAPAQPLPAHVTCRGSCGCMNASPHTLQAENQLLSQKFHRLQQEVLEFQQKSWFLPYLFRDLCDHMNDEKQFLQRIMEDLQQISNGNLFLLLTETPIHRQDEASSLYLAASLRDGEVTAYTPGERTEISHTQSMTALLNDVEAKQYAVLLLYAGDTQYGLLVCDSSQPTFFQAISLQLGLAFQLLEHGKRQAAHLLELSDHLEKMRRQNEELDILSHIDELTGLLNARGFMERSERLRPVCGSVRAYVIYGDLDHLKEINDTWGHDEGNYALQAASQILKSCLRESDVLARMGGDEFLALAVADISEFESIFRERISRTSQRLNQTSNKPYYVELSLGVASFDFDQEANLQDVISKADARLYQHKQRRRHSVRRRKLEARNQERSDPA
jgi:diguanylate cyclase (GGDEF)-like protein